MSTDLYLPSTFLSTHSQLCGSNSLIFSPHQPHLSRHSSIQTAMDSVHGRDAVLLGYVPRKSLGSPSTPDVDFRDVFGGPPRRSSMQDRSSHSGEEDASVFRNPWSGLGEKPVFGEESSRLKKHPSDDFFDDIFRGDESSNSTPRRLSRDPFSSSSPGGSMRASPSRSSSSLSLPPMLSVSLITSLPVKVGKEMDSSAFVAQSRPRKNKETALIGHPSSPGASTSRFSIQVTQGQDGSKNDSKSSYRQSSLSREVSLNNDGSIQSTKSDKNKNEEHNEEDSSSSEVSFNSNQFHFSIYKWPSTVVPVLMLPRREGKFLSSTESSKSDTVVTAHAAENDFSWVSQENKHDNSVLSTKAESIDSVESGEQVVSVKPEPKPLSNFQNIFRKVQGNLRSNSGKDIKNGSGSSGIEIGSLGVSARKMSVFRKEESKLEEPLYCLLKENKPGSGARDTDNCSIENKEKGIPISENELPKPAESPHCLLKEMKNDVGSSGVVNNLLRGTGKKKPIINKETPKAEEPLYCLLKTDSMGQGNDKATDKVSAKKARVKNGHTSIGGVAKDRKVKKQTGKQNNLSVQDIPDNSEDKPLDSKVKEKVKDVVKNFSQESPSKSSSNVETRDQGVTVTATGPAIEEDQTTVRAAKADQSNTRKVDQSSKQFAKPQRQIKTVADIGIERNSGSTPFSETIIENFEIAVDNVEESCEDLDCTVQELTIDQNNQLQSGQDYEELQASDAKIRKWSNGKEGNIRSLLSTLQYVLWPGSGWKPVPLVDIIEGSSVRRAYQKALLCLHPDKLQQKGAASHQKYIAEKVFDILQEAWTHFNSLGSL